MKYLLVQDTASGPITVFDCGSFAPSFDRTRRAWLVDPGNPDADPAIAPTYYTDGGEGEPLLRVQEAPDALPMLSKPKAIRR